MSELSFFQHALGQPPITHWQASDNGKTLCGLSCSIVRGETMVDFALRRDAARAAKKECPQCARLVDMALWPEEAGGAC